nr:ribonuclease H-like domain-containing protein [Tanacetum cinerariifolium]
MAFVSSLNKNSTNGAVNTANVVSTVGTQINTANIDNLNDDVICAFLASQPSSSQLVNEDLEQIHPDDLEEIDLKWQMAMLTMRAKRFQKNIGKKLNLNENETVSFDKTKMECFNCHRRATLQENVKHQVEPAVKTLNAKTSEDVPKVVKNDNGARIIKDWKSYDEDEINAARQKFSKAAVTVNSDRPVNTAHLKTTMNAAKPRCLVTILNTIDHLGKFDGKADEGFFIGYPLNSKAFRVFNSRTWIVEETLHIRFSENTPNNMGSGPNWRFDIDV